MKKTTKIVSIILIAIIVTITIASASIYYPNGAQTAPQVKVPDGVAPEWQIKVSGNVEQEKTWTLEEITHMPLTRVTAEVNGENATFGGVALVDFCNKTGAKWDTQTIKVISTDGQSAALNIFQAWNSTEYPYYQRKQPHSVSLYQKRRVDDPEDRGTSKTNYALFWFGIPNR